MATRTPTASPSCHRITAAAACSTPATFWCRISTTATTSKGTGTTIVRITPSGARSVFFQGDPGLGLTTALGVLKNGFVIVGNVPTSDGTFDTINRGSLLILDSNGNVVETLSSRRFLDGPWDLAINDQGNHAQVFVSNVLNGTITRIDLRVRRTATRRLFRT